MKRTYQVPLLAAALVSFACVAHAQQPPDPVPSDNILDTAVGGGALQSLQPVQPPTFTQGAYGDTAVGAYALWLTTTGNSNTAVGANALTVNTTGNGNTASGYGSLEDNTTGANNTATGISTLGGNTTGSYNVATGSGALDNNSTGNENTGDGLNTLYTNLTGSSNAAFGSSALFYNTVGNYNTGAGYHSLYSNTTGSDNTAVGINALGTNQGGSNNIAIGASAGYYIRGSRYNIDIGNVGNAMDVGLIRIGTSGQQSAAYIAGISGAHVTGSAVYITSTGQLGVLASSERYKTAIAPMGASTEKLGQLRPVTFRLKTDAKRTVQYGLIAEEVAKVYPELVIRDGAGKIQGVRYEELAPMLLNEAQQQRQEIDQLKHQLAQLQAMFKPQTQSELIAQR